MSDFRNLKVWQKAHVMALGTHRLAGRLRGTQVTALKTQMTRAAMSVPTNIVESRGQASRKESARFLRIAINSTTELEYHLIVAHDLKAISSTDCDTLTEQLTEIRKMIYGMLRHLSAEDGKA